MYSRFQDVCILTKLGYKQWVVTGVKGQLSTAKCRDPSSCRAVWCQSLSRTKFEVEFQ